MTFTFSDWRERISKRGDITGMLTHLTRPSAIPKSMNEQEINRAAIDNLLCILKDKCINESTTKSGFIVGNTPAVCFQDAPLYGIIQNIQTENDYRKTGKTEKIRYCAVGLLFSKHYVYGQGGRPVIYDRTEEAKKYLREDNYWRIVNFELSTSPPRTIDWSHEREWRVPHQFQFEYDLTHIVLYDKDCFDYFNQKCDSDIIKRLHGITVFKSIIM